MGWSAMAVEDQDRALIRRCLEGDTRAFGELVDRYQKLLFNVALRMLNSDQDAEDVTQTVFLTAFTKLETYDPKHRFFSWIYRMTVNESLNCLKRGKRFDPLEETLSTPRAAPDRALDAAELEERVGAALMCLTPDDRAVVVLRHFMGLSYKEMASILETKGKTVKSRLYSARQRLKDIFVQGGLRGGD